MTYTVEYYLAVKETDIMKVPSMYKDQKANTMCSMASAVHGYKFQIWITTERWKVKVTRRVGARKGVDLGDIKKEMRKIFN